MRYAFSIDNFDLKLFSKCLYDGTAAITVVIRLLRPMALIGKR